VISLASQFRLARKRMITRCSDCIWSVRYEPFGLRCDSEGDRNTLRM
jgi:hypothetical protein